MNIGILTFHWATNYGAVLQAIALQDYLMENYSDSSVNIIDYSPKEFKKSFFKSFHSKRIKNVIYNLAELRKEKTLKKDRKAYLRCSSHFSKRSDLEDELLKYDCIVVGSDQVWSPYYAQIDNSYYLSDFVLPGIRKIAYAASFGVFDFSFLDIKKQINSLKCFDMISVREQSGFSFLTDYCIKSTLVPDPTLLHTISYYQNKFNLQLYESIPRAYFVRLIDSHSKDMIKKICLLEHEKDGSLDMINFCSLSDWISKIKSSKFIITNSYHCMIVCILFSVPFYLVLEEGDLSEMNDRFQSLLNAVGYDKKLEPLKRIIVNNHKLNSFRERGVSFINKALRSFNSEGAEK